jgi:hypothetical protein
MEWRRLLVTLLWTGIVLLAVVVTVHVATNAALETVSGNNIGSLSRAEINDIARKAAKDASRDSGSTAKDWVQSIQAVVTTAAVLLAGVWALMVVLWERSIAGTVQVLIEAKGTMTSKNGIGAVVSVAVKNVGRAAITKTDAKIHAEPLDQEQLELLLEEGEVIEPATLRGPSAQLIEADLFEGNALMALNPGQEASEEVVLVLDKARVARVEAYFDGPVRQLISFRSQEHLVTFFDNPDRRFSSRIYLDMAALEEAEEDARAEHALVARIKRSRRRKIKE